jgi:FtsH-binding integral membrane protein
LKSTEFLRLFVEKMREVIGMIRIWTVQRRYLIGHAALMLALGMALFALGSLMTTPVHRDLSYAVALGLTFLCLLATSAYLGVLTFRERHRRLLTAYLLTGALSISCWLIVWMIQSAPSDLRLLAILAGLHGLFWGLWYVRLAFHFPASPRKMVPLCVLAAALTALGVIIATQSELSRLNATTAVACYSAFIGLQILLTTLYLNRDCDTSRETVSAEVPKSRSEESAVPRRMPEQLLNSLASNPQD